MEIIGCGRGHYYDPSQYSSCPQCAIENGRQPEFILSPGPTVPASIPMADVGKTEPIGMVMDKPKDMGAPMPAGAIMETEYFRDGGTAPGQATFDGNVQSYEGTTPVGPIVDNNDAKKKPRMPVVGWLACIDGPAKGSDYRLHSQYNYIGRALHMDVCISGDNSISAEKAATLAYDNVNKKFFFGPGLGLNLVRVNGAALLTPTELHAYDELTIGMTKLLFIPLCGERFDWDGK